MRHWGVLNVPMAAFASQVHSPFLDWEQRGRLSYAITVLWEAGQGAGATEETWRRALGYSLEGWAAVRDAFAEVLNSEGGYNTFWFLPFLRAEAQRQQSVSQAKAAAGSKGNEARWGSQTIARATPSENGDRKPSPSAVDSDSDSETLNLTPLTPPATSRRRESGDWTKAFEEHFWPAYKAHRSTGKAAALAVWARLDPKSQETFEAIWAGLQACITGEWRGKDPQYIPHARTWLFQRRWLDHAGSETT
jgi:hypothetical protein